MDLQKLRTVVKGTLDPRTGKEAEEQLNKIRKIAGFGPALMQMVMSEELDIAEKQAAVIYMKNLITMSWTPPVKLESLLGSTTDILPEDEFSIHEQDKAFIKDNLVDAIVFSSDVVRVQLGVSALHILKQDFPEKWPSFAEKIIGHLNTQDTKPWHGALLCLYQLTKTFEYKKPHERKSFYKVMNVVLPMLSERVSLLHSHQTDENMLLQKNILKIFFALTQNYYPTELLTEEVLVQWMQLFRDILTRPATVGPLPDNLDDRPEMPGWKLYKWALHILNRIFDRYGCPSTCNAEHKKFSQWYMRTFSEGINNVLLSIMNRYAEGEYISPRVMHLILSYIDCGLGRAMVWKQINPHMGDILQKIIFPHMRHTEQDQELWDSNPVDYIRAKNDLCEDLVSPCFAAAGVLQTVVRKRKHMLERVMAFVMTKLNMPDATPTDKDGCFHMMGSISNALTKREGYREKLEAMVLQFVLPELTSEYGFLRARAFSLLRDLAEIPWTSNNPSVVKTPNTKIPANLSGAVEMCIHAILHDPELPVRAEASLCLASFIHTQDEYMEELLLPSLPETVRMLIVLIKETESEEITNVMARIVQSYSTHLQGIAVDIASELARTFKQVVMSEEGADDQAITAMSLLGTVETLMSGMEECPEVVAKLEPIVLQLVALILENSIVEFYEEALSLIYNMTANRITSDMWQCFELLQKVFDKDGYDYFMEMLPVLHNYVTVDTPAFLSVENRLSAMCLMAQKILEAGDDEDAQCHAAKLLEVIVLQCNPNAQVLHDITVVVQTRLFDATRIIQTAELRTMLLQVLISGLFISTESMVTILHTLRVQGTDTPMMAYLLKQWMDDIDCFLGLHDRKVAVLGLCTVLRLGPSIVNGLAGVQDKLLSSMLVLFQGLKRAYVNKAAEDGEDSDSENESDFDENDALDDNEDELNDDDIIGSVNDKIQEGGCPFEITSTIEDDEETQGDEEDLDDFGDYGEAGSETGLEAFTTPLDKEDTDIDEYCYFKTVMCGLEGTEWGMFLTAQLTEEQKKELMEVATMADQRRAVAESKKIQQSGGYNFEQMTVPQTFNFGDGSPSS